MTEYTINNKDLNSPNINFKFKDMYKVLSSKALDSKYEPELTESIVRTSSKLFSQAFYNAHNTIKDTEISMSSDILKTYSSYIASKVVEADLCSSSEYDSDTASARIAGNGLVGKNLLNPQDSQITIVKKTLENLVDHIKESGNPSESAIEFFSEYSNQASQIVESITTKKTYSDLSTISWDIGGYRVRGIEKPKKIVQVNHSNGFKSTIRNEDSRFYTPLKPISLPEDKVLRKDQIVGDKSVVDHLERMVQCLFLYNPKYGINPMKTKGLFKNKILIQGLEGTGKGVLSFYAMDYARRFNENLDAGLMITTLNIDSHWKDGRIQRLKSQFNQLANNNTIYLVYEDELDGLLKNENSNLQSKSDLNDINEFNKFMDGEYPDRGNYLFIGNINDSTNLRKSNLSRFHLVNWKGAHNPKEKSMIFKNILSGKDFVKLDEKDYKELGKMAYDYGLNGRQIADISKSSLSSSITWENIQEVFDARENIEKQYERIDSLHTPIFFDNVKKELTNLVHHKENSTQDSKTFNLT